MISLRSPIFQVGGPGFEPEPFSLRTRIFHHLLYQEISVSLILL